MQMTAGRSSRWISKRKKVCSPCVVPGQELCTSQQETRGVSEKCATASISWVVCELGGQKEEGAEAGPPWEEVGDPMWVLHCTSCPRWCMGEQGQFQRCNLSGMQFLHQVVTLGLKRLRNLPTKSALSKHGISVHTRVQPVISLPSPTLVFSLPGTWTAWVRVDC